MINKIINKSQSAKHILNYNINAIEYLNKSPAVFINNKNSYISE